MFLLELMANFIGLIGVGVIFWGAMRAIIGLLRSESSKSAGALICKQREHLRHHFGSFILLGLEFLLAADIILTIVEPSTEGLIILGSIIILRSIIGFFLDKEIGKSHNCNNE
ncbi:MAG: DUF1622 domain-containing protein [DPANN group archaeon]|nr:DUF1622 domain-containing protein [DPANN group archaeon]